MRPMNPHARFQQEKYFPITKITRFIIKPCKCVEVVGLDGLTLTPVSREGLHYYRIMKICFQAVIQSIIMSMGNIGAILKVEIE